jgi:hypothetical protein
MHIWAAAVPTATTTGIANVFAAIRPSHARTSSLQRLGEGSQGPSVEECPRKVIGHSAPSALRTRIALAKLDQLVVLADLELNLQHYLP